MNKDNAYVQWIGFIRVIFHTIEEGSLLDAEDALEENSKPLQRFPLVKEKQIYLRFFEDVCDLKLNGADDNEVLAYIECAMSTLNQAPPEGFDPLLLRCIAITLQRFLKGSHPQFACEFGRASIPYSQRPEREEFSSWIRRLKDPEPVKSYDELFVRAEAFVQAVDR